LAYIVLDSETVSALGLFETPFEVELTLADERKDRAKLYLAEVEVEGRKGPALVAALDVPAPCSGSTPSKRWGSSPTRQRAGWRPTA